MQYHQMLKQKHETEEKQAAEAAKKRKEIEAKVNAAKQKVLSIEDIAKAKEDAAEEAAKELLRMEERNNSKKAFKGDGMKKGFLTSSGKKK
jgi:hypothetical protein